MKKLLSLIMCMVLAATLFVAAPAYADDWTVPEGYTQITLAKDKNVAYKYDSENTTLYIAGSGGTPHQSLNSSCGEGKNATKIVVESGVTELGYNSLKSFDKVTEVVLPASLKTLQAGVFEGCSKLTKVNLPENLTTIGNYVFLNCKALTEIPAIPKSVTSIGYNFLRYSQVKKVEFESGRTTDLTIKHIVLRSKDDNSQITVDEGVFGLAPALTEIYLPEKVKIATDAVSNDDKVTDIVHLFGKASGDSSNDTNPSKLTIWTEDESVKTAIDSLTDTNERGKPTINVVPKGTEKYGTINHKNGQFTGYWTYGNGQIDLYGTGDYNTGYYQKQYAWKDDVVGTDVKKIVVHEGVTGLPTYFTGSSDATYSYKRMTNIEEVVLPSTLKSIPQAAFENCTKLKSVMFSKPNGELTTEFPDGLESIGMNAFMSCPIGPTNGNALVLPASLKTLADGAFRNESTQGTAFSSVVFAKGSKLESIGNNCFAGRYGIRTIEIPSTVTSIGENAFNSSAGDNLKVYFEGTKPTTIGTNAFARTGNNATVSVYCYEDGYDASDFGSLSYLTVKKLDKVVEATVTLDTTDDSNVTAKVDFRAPEKMDNNQSYVLIIAAYDSNDTLVGVDVSKTGSFEADTTSIESGSITHTISKVSGAATYKAFLWDSLTDITPIASAK